METLRACIFSLCAACVVVGILERVSMSRGRFSVIKLVGTLYILATVFVPFKEMAGFQWTPELPTMPGAVETPDTARLVLTAAEQALATQVGRALEGAGIPFRAVEVVLDEQAGDVALRRVTVIVPAGADTQAAAQTAAQAIGAQAPVEVRGEGT